MFGTNEPKALKKTKFEQKKLINNVISFFYFFPFRESVRFYFFVLIVIALPFSKTLNNFSTDASVNKAPYSA